MKFEALVNYLDKAFPKNLSAAWDNDGVEVCTDLNLEIGRILLTLDITFETLDYAATHGYNCIIAHHPMIFSPLRKLDMSTAASRKAVFLAGHNICAVSLHTRLDSASGGVNDCLLRAIGVSPDDKTQTEIFGTDDCEYAGRIFSYSADSAKDFAVHVKKSLEDFYKNNFASVIPVSVRYTEGDKPVRTVAAVSGSGIDFAEKAISLGADTFLTGESSYHKTIDAHEYNSKGGRINIVSAGHFETEALVLPHLKKIIASEFSGAAIDIHAMPPEKYLV